MGHSFSLFENIVERIRRNHQLLLPLLPHPFGPFTLLVRESLLPPLLGPDEVGVDVLGVLVQRLSAEGAAEDPDGVQDEPGHTQPSSYALCLPAFRNNGISEQRVDEMHCFWFYLRKP